MGSSIPAVIDYLITGLAAPLAAIEPTTVLADGMPLTASETMVVVGRTSPESGNGTIGEDAYVELGAQRIQETYTLPIYVDVFREGPAQKPARDAAFGLYDAVVKFVAADPTLGELLTQGRIAQAARLSLHQTQDDQDTAGGGYMRAQIQFELQIQNTYFL